MSHKRSIIAALCIGWVSGAGSWYFISKGQDVADGQSDVPSAALNPSVDESGGERLAVFPPPVGAGNPPAVSARATLPPMLHHTPPETPVPLMETGEAMGAFGDDGVVQDTGEFIDADDPQATIAYLNARSVDDTVQDTGEFIDVDNPPIIRAATLYLRIPANSSMSMIRRPMQPIGMSRVMVWCRIRASSLRLILVRCRKPLYPQ